jgi:hypothetical protein
MRRQEPECPVGQRDAARAHLSGVALVVGQRTGQHQQCVQQRPAGVGVVLLGRGDALVMRENQRLLLLLGQLRDDLLE